jgi:hypothetical protein
MPASGSLQFVTIPNRNGLGCDSPRADEAAAPTASGTAALASRTNSRRSNMTVKILLKTFAWAIASDARSFL